MKRYFRYGTRLCALCVGLSGLSVRAENVAGRESQTASQAGQQIFEAAPSLPAVAKGDISVWGVVLWCLVFLALAGALAYMVVNIVRRKKFERLRSERAMGRPHLVISEAYRKENIRKGNSR